MSGRLIGLLIVATAAVAGITLYWLQVYAFYEDVPQAQAEDALRLTELISGEPHPIPARDIQAIDADSSPLRFRACFSTPLSLAMLSETYLSYDDPTPLNAPGWFDCFGAAAIGDALEEGRALAFLGQRDISQGFDRVIAVFPDGSAYAWHQQNGTFGE